MCSDYIVRKYASPCVCVCVGGGGQSLDLYMHCFYIAVRWTYLLLHRTGRSLLKKKDQCLQATMQHTQATPAIS